MEFALDSTQLVGIFLLQIYILSILSTGLFNQVYQYFHKLFKNNQIVVFLISFLFLPGTLIHELSHVFSAIILGAKVKSFSVWPKFENDSIKMGYAEITKLDIFRNILIGISPLVFGVLINYFLIINFYSSSLSVKIIYLYLIFQVSNSMFLSNSDVEEFKKLILILFSIFGLVYLIDIYYLKQGVISNLYMSLHLDIDLNFLINLNSLFFLILIINLLILLVVRTLNFFKVY